MHNSSVHLKLSLCPRMISVHCGSRLRLTILSPKHCALKYEYIGRDYLVSASAVLYQNYCIALGDFLKQMLISSA